MFFWIYFLQTSQNPCFFSGTHWMRGWETSNISSPTFFVVVFFPRYRSPFSMWSFATMALHNSSGKWNKNRGINKSIYSSSNLTTGNKKVQDVVYGIHVIFLKKYRIFQPALLKHFSGGVFPNLFCGANLLLFETYLPRSMSASESSLGSWLVFKEWSGAKWKPKIKHVLGGGFNPVEKY